MVDEEAVLALLDGAEARLNEAEAKLKHIRYRMSVNVVLALVTIGLSAANTLRSNRTREDATNLYSRAQEAYRNAQAIADMAKAARCNEVLPPHEEGSEDANTHRTRVEGLSQAPWREPDRAGEAVGHLASYRPVR